MADATGLIYASFRGDTKEIISYSGALAIPYVAAPVFKAAIKESKLLLKFGKESLTEAKAYYKGTLKTELDKPVIVSKLADGVVNNLDDFVKLSKSQKIKYLNDAWKAYYPKIFFERRLFEDMMSKYRYLKAVWGNTNEIAKNFKAIDFYKKGTVLKDKIYTELAVSMKTTTTIDVNKWLKSNPIKDNINKLNKFKGADKGIKWKGKTIIYNKAEIHIYMPKEKFTKSIQEEWLRV